MTVELAHSKGPIDVDSINPDKSYRAVIQLGANRRWRQFGHGSWVLNREFTEDGVKRRSYKHAAALHEVGPVSGSILRGLAVHHNEWLSDNATKRTIGTRDDKTPIYSGDIGRQLLIVDYNETTEPANDNRLRVGTSAWYDQVFKSMAKSVLAELKQA
jgi:hypothetical protein